MGEAGEEKKRPCNARIEELAKPNKRLLLDLWQNYAHHFNEEKKEAIRLLLQEMFAMTPEETQKYFEEISEIMKRLAAREKLKKKLARKYHKKLREMERKRALSKFRSIFVRLLTYASKNPVPPLVSPRLRNMSDLILYQLCDLRGIIVPDRSDNDKQAQFLCNTADWISIAIEYIYYEIHVQKNKELEKIEDQIIAEKMLDKAKNKSKKKKM
ncbi:hypothetical protein RI129_007385 [Pyrocoelia pectoralis]|uniref:Uncharacterized protein n=1 Tax=Pyrocoelia pectoralis TaxID=417401 RepID=A0AAN7V7U6_9COLE